MANASGLFSTNTRERVKAFLIVVVGAIGTALYKAIEDLLNGGGSFPTTWPEWQKILLTSITTGIAAGATYLGVTFSTNANKPNLIEKAIKKDKEGLS